MPTKEIVKRKPLKDEMDDEEYEYVTIPPDGGFGWVVALAAMLCNLVCDGTLFAFGAMKLHLQAHFNCSDMLILMVGSVPCGVYLLVGPIVSGLANRYGCRPIIIIGSIGASIIYGVFGGVFFGMIFLPSVVMVSFYFEKRRAVANGLVTAGTGIGALSFGPLANRVMSKLGWKAGMFVFAGIMLTCILFGAIMKPLKPRKVPVRRAPVEAKTPVNTQATPSPSVTVNNANLSRASEVLPPSYTDTVNNKNLVSVPSSAIFNFKGISRDSRVRQVSVSSRTSLTSTGEHHLGVADPENASRPLYKKDALFTGSKQQLHLSHTSLHSNPYISSVTNIPASVTETRKKQSAVRAFADILSAMTDLSILKNKQMLLICIGNIFTMLGYYLPIMCLVSFAVQDNQVAQEDASYLLTVFGTFNTIGRFASGPIALIPHFGALRVHNTLLYVAGILTVLAAYAYNFATCALYAALCGFAIAPHMSLLPSVICDCVGLDRYTNAFGILCLFRGVTSIIGPPAAGLLKDYTQRYDMSFAIGGAMIIIGAFFHFVISRVEPDRRVAEEEVDV